MTDQAKHTNRASIRPFRKARFTIEFIPYLGQLQKSASSVSPPIGHLGTGHYYPCMSARFPTSRHPGIAENPLASAPSCFRADALRHDPTTQGRRRHAGQAKIQQQRFDDIVDADYDGASPLPHSEMSTTFGRSKSPGGSSPEMGDSWPPSSERLAAMHLRTRFGHPPSSVLRLIDTRRASPKWPLREVVCSRMPVRHYCGPIFLPQVANAIGGDDPRAGLQMGQAPRLLSAVG